MSAPDASLLEAAVRWQEGLVVLRRALHRRPETGLKLPETQQTLLEALSGLGLRVRTGEGLSSIVAVLDGALPGPAVLLRSDMDALPLREDTGLPFASENDSAMHACGHDAHAAMLVGAARLLAARRAGLAGRVVFAFQPGEEGHGGAKLMIDEGLLAHDGVPAAAFAIHVSPTDPVGEVATRPGALMAAADGLHVVVHGRGGHGSEPHDALDPVPIACEIVLAVQAFVTRRLDAFDPAVVTVGHMSAGAWGSVIPETATLVGTMRAVSERTRARVHEGVRRVAEGIAQAHGARAEVTIRPGVAVVLNDAGVTAAVTEAAAALLGAERVRLLPSPVMPSEDFAEILQRVPGTMVFLGARPDAEGPVASIHSNRMVLNESVLPVGAALHAAVALRLLDPARVRA